MMLGTWNPLRELEILRREVERAFDTVGLESLSRPFARTVFLPGHAPQTYPLLNLNEDKDNLYVEALAPGLNTDTLEVSVVRSTLRLTGEKLPLSEEIKPKTFHRNERGAGKFVRTLTLPVEVDGEKVTAEYHNGLLSVTLPKAEAAKPKQITIKVD